VLVPPGSNHSNHIMSGKRGGKRAGRGPGRPRNSDTSEEDYDSEVESSNWATEGDHHHQKLDKKFHEAKRMGLISSEEPSPQASDGDLDDNDTWVGSNNDGDGSSNDGDGSKNGGGSSTSDGSDSQDEQFSEDEPEGGQEEEEDVWAFYARIVKANCCLEETGLPPVLQTSRSSPGSWEGAIFVLPKDVQLTHMGKRKVKYNGAWVETGCACGPGDQTVYFCSCSAATANVKNILSLQTIATGGEEDHEGESSMPPANPVEQSCMLGSEQENCMHIQALQTIIDDGQFALRDIVNDLVFLAEERESEGDGEGGGDGGEGEFAMYHTGVHNPFPSLCTFGRQVSYHICIFAHQRRCIRQVCGNFGEDANQGEQRERACLASRSLWCSRDACWHRNRKARRQWFHLRLYVPHVQEQKMQSFDVLDETFGQQHCHNDRQVCPSLSLFTLRASTCHSQLIPTLSNTLHAHAHAAHAHAHAQAPHAHAHHTHHTHTHHTNQHAQLIGID
jgi:hypothetical protein